MITQRRYTWPRYQVAPKITELLLGVQKINVHATDCFGLMPLRRAADAGRTEKSPSSFWECQPSMCVLPTVLHDTTAPGCRSRSHREVTELLLEVQDINVHATDCFGLMPLSRAAEAGRTEVTKLLLEVSVINVHATDCSGLTPLHRAAEAGRTEKSPSSFWKYQPSLCMLPIVLD